MVFSSPSACEGHTSRHATRPYRMERSCRSTTIPRALIPGGIEDSVKWLRVEVLTAEPPPQDYVREVRSLLVGRQWAEPVRAMNVKSAFSRPVDGATLIGRHFVLRGVAWAGENRVRQVEVSVDGGKSWQAAHIESESRPYTWARWSQDWCGQSPMSWRKATTSRAGSSPRTIPSRVDDYEWVSNDHSVTVTEPLSLLPSLLACRANHDCPRAGRRSLPSRR
jgi:hypothetical protein